MDSKKNLKAMKFLMMTLAVVVVARLSFANASVEESGDYLENSEDTSFGLLPKNPNPCITRPTQKMICTGEWLGQKIQVDIQNKEYCQYFRYTEWGNWHIKVSTSGTVLAQLSKTVFDSAVDWISEDKLYSFQNSDIKMNEVFEILFLKNEKQNSGALELRKIESFESRPPATDCKYSGPGCSTSNFCKAGSKLSDDYCQSPTSYRINTERYELTQFKCEHLTTVFSRAL